MKANKFPIAMAMKIYAEPTSETDAIAQANPHNTPKKVAKIKLLFISYSSSDNFMKKPDRINKIAK